jgi:hypothetical protein
MRHRPDRKRRLSPCFQLLGLDGLVVTLVGGWGRGPLCHGAHAEVVAAAGKPLGASSTRPCWCRVVHTCRVEMELGLRLKVVVITLFL